MLLLLLAACAPGVLRTADGREPLRAAWYAPQEDGAPTLLLLSNSDLLCELPESDDPGEIQALLTRQQAGLTREGAAVIYGELAGSQGDLVGTYDVNPADGESRFMALSWWHVIEAVVDARDGIIVSYSPGNTFGDFEYLPSVPEPATLAITAEDATTIEGSFDAASLDVSGAFTATSCDPDASLFATLAF